MVNYNEHATTVDPWESNTYLRLVTVRKCSHITALILIPPLAAARLQRWALQLSARFSFITQRLTQMLMCYHIFHFSIQTIRNNQKLTFLLFDRLKLYPSHQHNSNMWQDVTPLWAKCTLCKASSGNTKTILEQLNRTDLARWLWHVGHKIRDTCQATRAGPTRVTWSLPWNIENQNIGEKSCVVARYTLKIEEMTKSCERCQAVRNSPPAAPLHPWSWSSHLWQRIHLNFAGPFVAECFFYCGWSFKVGWSYREYHCSSYHYRVKKAIGHLQFARTSSYW